MKRILGMAIAGIWVVMHTAAEAQSPTWSQTVGWVHAKLRTDAAEWAVNSSFKVFIADRWSTRSEDDKNPDEITEFTEVHLRDVSSISPQPCQFRGKAASCIVFTGSNNWHYKHEPRDLLHGSLNGSDGGDQGTQVSVVSLCLVPGTPESEVERLVAGLKHLAILNKAKLVDDDLFKP